MTYQLIKIIVSALIIVSISELSKRNTTAGALLASLPIVSILAMTWLYIDTKDVQQVAALSTGILWLVLPSLLLFIALPLLLKSGVNFYLSIFLSCLVMLCGYYLEFSLLKKLGVSIA